MKHVFPITAATLSVALLAGLVPGRSEAGVISNACMNSDRSAANSQICTCIQKAADMTLDNHDQRTAAQLFSQPDRAQEVKMSTSRRDETFWNRYTKFGATAQALCS